MREKFRKVFENNSSGKKLFPIVKTMEEKGNKPDTSGSTDDEQPRRGKSYSLPNVLYKNRRRTTTDFENTSDIANKLMEYCQKNNWNEVSNIMKTENAGEINFSLTDHESFTPLMHAVKANQVAVAAQMIHSGADLEERTKDGKTLMHIACAFGAKEIIRFLISKNVSAKIASPETNSLPLHLAINRPMPIAVAIVPPLLKYYPESRLVQDKFGVSPLMLACEKRYLSVCQELLSCMGEDQTKLRRKDDGDTVLHIAVKSKNLEILKLVIDHGAVIDAQNHSGKTALYLAVEMNFVEAVNLLYTANAGVSIVDEDRKSPLHIAVEMGHIAMVEILADKFKAPLCCRTQDGSSLIHIASKYGHSDVIQALLKRGVPLNLLNKTGSQGLHVAAAAGNTSIVKILLKKGANADSKTKGNYTCLHIAVQAGNENLTEILLSNGADAALRGGALGETPLHLAARCTEYQRAVRCAEMLIQCGADVDACLENGGTALHLAAINNNIKLVELLIKEGSNYKMLNHEGKNPLHLAVEWGHFEIAAFMIEYVVVSESKEDAIAFAKAETSQRGQKSLHLMASSSSVFDGVKILELLLKFDSDLTSVITETQETVLHLLARFNQINILRYLSEHISVEQLPINAQTKTGTTPLMEGCLNGHSAVVNTLLEHEAQYDLQDSTGKTALHIAAENGHHDICDALLRRNIYVDVRAESGMTVLHLAARNGHSNLVNLFVGSYNADMEAVDLDGNTAIHLAAEKGHMQICVYLLEKGAKAAVLNAKKHTPIHLATENDHPDIVKLFLSIHNDSKALLDHDVEGFTCAHIAAAKGSAAVLKELLKIDKDAILESKDSEGKTVLHLAVMNGHKTLVRILLNSGADSTLEDEDGMNPFMLAIKHGHGGLVKLFDGSLRNCMSRKTGLYPIHIACFYNRPDIVKFFIKNGISIVQSEKVDDPISPLNEALMSQHALTPLHMASLCGDDAILRILLNLSSTDIDARTEPEKFHALHLAAMSGHTSIATLLLNRSRSLLTAQDHSGRTALHHAAAKGQINVVSLLLSHGCDVNESDSFKWTPLHHACWSGQVEVVELLVKNRCALDALNDDGKLALCLAASKGHFGIVSRLLELTTTSVDFLLKDKEFLMDILPPFESNNFELIEKLILVSDFPLVTAAILSRNFKDLSEIRKIRSRTLLQCSDFCQSLACKLLNKFSNSNNNNDNISNEVFFEWKNEEKRPLIDILIDNEQKLIISHNLTQNYVHDLWLGGSSKFGLIYLFMLFFISLLVPPIWIFFALPIGRRAPVIKFIGHLISHIYFCLLLASLTLRFRPDFFNLTEYCLLIFIFGQIYREIKQKNLNILRLFQILLAISSTVVHIFAIFSTQNSKILFYIRNQLLSIVLLLSFVQFLEFLSLHHLFGPWAVTIRRLIIDLCKFWVILCIFLFGFSISIFALFLNEVETSQKSFLEIVEMLYFAMFGIIEPENIEISPKFAKITLKIAIAIYLMVVIVVLINLLIAMMSDTYRKIEDRSDLEWKFGRAKLIRQMIKTDDPAVPINLFYGAYVCIRSIKMKSERRKSNYSAVSSNSESTVRRSRKNSVVDWNRIVDAYKEESQEQFV